MEYPALKCYSGTCLMLVQDPKATETSHPGLIHAAESGEWCTASRALAAAQGWRWHEPGESCSCGRGQSPKEAPASVPRGSGAKPCQSQLATRLDPRSAAFQVGKCQEHAANLQPAQRERRVCVETPSSKGVGQRLSNGVGQSLQMLPRHSQLVRKASSTPGPPTRTGAQATEDFRPHTSGGNTAGAQGRCVVAPAKAVIGPGRRQVQRDHCRSPTAAHQTRQGCLSMAAPNPSTHHPGTTPTTPHDPDRPGATL